MHPLAGDFVNLKDSEIESKINDLTKKYFMTPNPGVQQQISNLLNDYKNELYKRQQEQLQKMMQRHSKDIDKLVNVS
jgi:hypothetical protein